MIHVVDVHRGPQLFALWPSALLKYSFSLLFGETWKARQRRRVIGPIRNVRDRANPDRCAAQPRVGSKLAASVPRCVDTPDTSSTRYLPRSISPFSGVSVEVPARVKSRLPGGMNITANVPLVKKMTATIYRARNFIVTPLGLHDPAQGADYRTCPNSFTPCTKDR